MRYPTVEASHWIPAGRVASFVVTLPDVDPVDLPKIADALRLALVNEAKVQASICACRGGTCGACKEDRSAF